MKISKNKNKKNKQFSEENLGHKTKEKASGELGGKFKSIFKNTNDGIVFLDKFGKILEINKKTAEIFGGSEKELIGKHFTKLGLFSVKELPTLIRDFANALAGGKAYLVVSFKNKKGRQVFLECSTSLLKIGGSIKMLSVMRDITERKQAEEALLKSEERFRLATQSSSDLIYEWDIGTKIEWFGNLDKLLGYARGEFPRTFEGWVNNIHPDDRNKVAVAVKNHLEKNKLYDIEYRVRKKDGNYNYWQARGMAVRDKKGNPYRWIGAIADITERKKAEEALLAAKDYTENIIKSMFDTLIVINPDGKIKSINEAVTVLLGYKEEELIGKPFGTILAEEEEEEEIPFIGTRLKKLINEGFIKEYNTAYKTKSGERIPVSLSGVVMRDKDDKLIGIIFIGRDLRDRKKAEEKLLHFQKAVDSATDAIGMSTPEGRHYYQNEAFTKLFGLSVSEVDGASGPPGTVYADEKVGRKVFDIIMGGGFF
jgi:PAS domain S-box-containing protein